MVSFSRSIPVTPIIVTSCVVNRLEMVAEWTEWVSDVHLVAVRFIIGVENWLEGCS